MNRILLGGLLALCLAGVGLFWLQGRAEIESAAPPPWVVASQTMDDPENLPGLGIDDLDGVLGPEPPEATELSREQRRFAGYDRNSDGRISRVEMLSRRTSTFRKLDKDGNNLLTFEEWAVVTVDRVEVADGDGNDWLSPAEFRTTAPPRNTASRKPRCACD